ncbi:MAG: DUF1911 domain-containing protein [Bacteroidetes bacterium]|nr:DUF1911 domain-containing protein [Bacteroidota bacterium]MBP6721109.1 DUF1911 domain-containing protein [Bacteroidia bacterium]
MRTAFKSEAYFDRFLAESLEIFEETKAKLGAGEIRSDRIPAVRRSLFRHSLHRLIANYSYGVSIKELTPMYRESLSLISICWPDDGSEDMPDYLKDWYVKMLWMLSFGIFLNISDEDFAKIVSVWDKTGRQDWLIDYLIAYRIPDRPIVDTLIFPKPYAALKKAVDESDPHKRSAIVKHYLEKEWYSGQKGVYWYEDHKNVHDIFFGYWSFESAAVVKIAGIDDSSFRDNMYYPKDLL